MAITRRAFLGSLGIGAAAVAFGGVSQPASAAPAVEAPPVAATLGESLRQGDVFTIAGRYALNPRTQQPTGHLQQFVVTANVPAGDRLHTKDIWPKPMLDGPYANVTGLPVGETVDGRDVCLMSWGAVVPCKVTWTDA